MTELAERVERPSFANFVGGEWRTSIGGSTYEKRNPARPNELIGEFPASDQSDVEAAVTAAASAFPDWSSTPIAGRAAVLQRAADLIEQRAEAIALDMTLEMGKPLRESRLEARRAAQILRFYASEAWSPLGELYEQSTGGAVYTVRRALGVVGLITPWNFPAAIPTWKLGPALIYGNTVVIKLAQDAPLTGLHIASALTDAGIPAGALNVIVGPGSKAGRALVTNPTVEAISFTGSVSVGEEVRDVATALGKKVQLELGGQNPMIVLADADLEKAVEAAFAGAYFSAGQKCTATRRIYIEGTIYERFKQALLARIENSVVGDPSDPATEVGPVVNEQQVKHVLDAIKRGRDEGGTVLIGGRRIEGNLIAPTLFEDVADDALLSCEEVFGPLATLYRCDGLDDALPRANAVPVGLSAALFTSNLASARTFVQRIRVGLVHVNSQTAGADVHVPFGGIKAQAMGLTNRDVPPASFTRPRDRLRGRIAVRCGLARTVKPISAESREYPAPRPKTPLEALRAEVEADQRASPSYS